MIFNKLKRIRMYSIISSEILCLLLITFIQAQVFSSPTEGIMHFVLPELTKELNDEQFSFDDISLYKKIGYYEIKYNNYKKLNKYTKRKIAANIFLSASNTNYSIEKKIKKQLKKIKFDKKKSQWEITEKQILENTDIKKLCIVIENIKNLNKYLNINEDEIVFIIDKLKKIGTTGNIFYSFTDYYCLQEIIYLLYAVTTESFLEPENNLVPSNCYLFLAINSEFLNFETEKDYKQAYIEIVNNARSSMAKILLEENKKQPVSKKDIDSITKKINKFIIRLSKKSKDIEVYQMTLDAIKESLEY